MVQQKFLYCITHEAWIYPELMDYIGKDCWFTTSEPPELSMDESFMESLIPPSDDELCVMDTNADLLLKDFDVL